MSALPRVSGFRMRSMHTRGIDNCIAAGMVDVNEIARASAIPSGEIVEAALTKVQRMNMGKAKKAHAQAMLAEAKDTLGE